jgi:hypothetical protein
MRWPMPFARAFAAAAFIVASTAPSAMSGTAIGTSFTYQGSLNDGGVAPTAFYDFRFTLYDAAAGGNVVSTSLEIGDVSVVSGIFTVDLDFGATPFGVAEARWLLVEVRPGASTGAYTALPRQRLSPTPSALGLSLPHSQTVASTAPLFSLYNTGGGNGGEFGTASGSYGVVGRTSSTVYQASGVYGENTGASGNTIGVYGVATASETGTGLVGTGAATGAYITGTGTDATGVYALGGFRGLFAQSTGTGSAIVASQQGTGDYIVCTGPAGTTFWVDNAGVTHTKVLEILGGADLSERFEIGARDGSDLEPGTVVSIDAAHEGRLVMSQEPYDHRVAGIISGAGGVKVGLLLGQEGSIASGSHPVALTGRVYCRASAVNGPIRPGDLLTTSSIPGHAMRVDDSSRARGAILGKAMGTLERGEGLVLVLVGLQ